jgi:hypothetical protein
MSRCRFSILAIAIILLVNSCVTTTSHYGTKLTATDVGVVLLQLDDRDDNSELRGNQFLKDEIIAGIATKLHERGITAIAGPSTDMEGVSHILVLKSGGVSKKTGVRPVRTTYQHHSGINSAGQAHSYSTPHVSGGGTYSVTLVKVTATLYSVDKNGSQAEVCRSYAKGDGQNILEGYVRSAAVVPRKKIAPRYIRTFTDAALSVFAEK